MRFSAAHQPVRSIRATGKTNRPGGVLHRLPLIAVSVATFILICEQPSAIAQQDQSSPYVQPVPNYVAQAQNKPTPYQYAQPAPQDRSNQDQYRASQDQYRASGQDQGAGYGVAPGPDATQQQYAAAPPADAQGSYGAQQQQPYGQQPDVQQGGCRRWATPRPTRWPLPSAVKPAGIPA
jgi:hypothetical protein